MQKLCVKLSKMDPRRPPRSPLLISHPDYIIQKFFSAEVTIFLNLPVAIKPKFSIECFYIRLLWFETKVFHSYLQHYGTTQAMRRNCSKFQLLLDCFVMNGIFKKHNYIALTCSISCVSFLVLSSWFCQWLQTRVFAPNQSLKCVCGVFLWSSGFLGFYCVTVI